jgi:hypothetical protein
MGLFSHHESEPETGEFMGLALDAEALHTPAGVMPLGEITRADFHRDIVGAGREPDETSTAAVVGGAAVGAVAFGAVGAVAGGLLGSTVKEPGEEILKTTGVRLIFESRDVNYSLDIPRDQEGGAIKFADTVQRAMKHHKG